MQRLRRTRTPAPVPGRVRRQPRPFTTAGSTVTATITISAEIAEGHVSEEEFTLWLHDAIERYHLWRNGWVGLGMTGRLLKPEEA